MTGTDCEKTVAWVWEARHEHEEPPEPVARHLIGCEACQGERSARLALSRDLRHVRPEDEGELPEGLDERVLAAAHAAVSAIETGRFRFEGTLDGVGADLDPDTLSEIDTAIARDLRDTGRVAIRPEWQAPDESRASAWTPPTASIRWMVAACLLLVSSLALGFAAGRVTAEPTLPLHAALATAPEGLVLGSLPRVHSVGLSSEAVDTIARGNTYLLAGPLGGPYEVMGVVRWDETDTLPVPLGEERGEIVVAVGPAGGWSRGKQLALNDLSASSVEILGRRAIDSPR